LSVILETRNLTYTYDHRQKALDSVNLEIEEGQTTAILGGNGSGKSTLFLNLNGVLRPSAGEVLYRGQAISYGGSAMMAHRKRVGIVFQNPDDQLFSTDVRSDIAFGLLNLGLSQAEAAQRVEAVMTQVGVSQYADAPTHALSFGQKKRVAIAGVLAMEPEVIILDEPTAGLDPKGVSDILSLLLHLRKQQRLTVILSTHEIDLVPLYCDKVFVMDQGRVVMRGTSSEIFKAPGQLRTHNLRLPRIAHLMEILRDKDGLELEAGAATIGQARKSFLKWVRRG